MKGAHNTQLSVQTAERAVFGASFAPLPRLTSVFGACELACKRASAYLVGLTAFCLAGRPLHASQSRASVARRNASKFSSRSTHICRAQIEVHLSS